ncbi:rubredoxin [Cupriavidus basilensis]|uniref:rubredoxin n=1 Tax=Cupriavidus basilensis TaxID=68895 RepID=UPI0028415C61|nr:rubredoxin [Cupriavidus basilensis]MDR3381425.1 rubredoxin [Cupriavidus basilensis]
MYKKGTAVEIQFSPKRLNDGAGDPYWIDLTTEEAQALLALLQARLAPGSEATAAPLVFSLDEPEQEKAAAQPEAPIAAKAASAATDAFKQWVCIICGWVYDEAAGLPEDDIAPGTRWEDIPDDWRCPLCDVGKEDFAMVEF